MSIQDDMATIECLCAVIRAYMLEAAEKEKESLSFETRTPDYDIFNDRDRGERSIEVI